MGFRFQNVTHLLYQLSGHDNKDDSEESENVKTFQLVSPSMSNVRSCKQSTRRVRCNDTIPNPKRKLDSRAFEYCFQ